LPARPATHVAAVVVDEASDGYRRLILEAPAASG